MNDTTMDAAQNAAEAAQNAAEAKQRAAEDKAAEGREKNLTAVKNEITLLSQRIADAVNALATVAQNQGRRLRLSRSDVDQAVSGASDRAGAVASAAKDAASSIADRLTGVIRERPVAAVALALGVGFVMGVAWRR
jgi:ElaB/YqjD/DUF883 family membrane-anchored ribosome-binding protein